VLPRKRNSKKDIPSVIFYIYLAATVPKRLQCAQTGSVPAHLGREVNQMANDGWFKCDKCGDEIKLLVPDWVKALDEPCECGGTYRKT